MHSPLSHLLFKEYRRRVLGLLLLRPDQTYHVREIERLAPLAERIDVALVFGSVASGKATLGSDIEINVIGGKDDLG